MKKLLERVTIIAILFFLQVACSTQIEGGGNQISELQKEEPIATQTPEPTNSNSVISIPATNTTPRKIFDYSSLNILGEFESGGVLIEVRGISIGTKSKLIAEGLDFLSQEEFGSSDIIGEITFVIANNIEERVKIFPSSVVVEINGEQVDLSEWWNENFSTPCGHIYPGITRAGSIWFNISSLELQEINEMKVFIKAPYKGGDKTFGEDYYFELDISNHIIGE